MQIVRVLINDSVYNRARLDIKFLDPHRSFNTTNEIFESESHSCIEDAKSFCSINSIQQLEGPSHFLNNLDTDFVIIKLPWTFTLRVYRAQHCQTWLSSVRVWMWHRACGLYFASMKLWSLLFLIHIHLSFTIGQKVTILAIAENIKSYQLVIFVIVTSCTGLSRVYSCVREHDSLIGFRIHDLFNKQ